MESIEMLQMQLVALLPSAATIIAVIILTLKIVLEFKGLRSDVQNDSEVKELRAENKRLQAMQRNLADQQMEYKKDTEMLMRKMDEQNRTIRRLEKKLGESGNDEKI